MGYRCLHDSYDTLRYVQNHRRVIPTVTLFVGYDQGVFGGIIVTQDFLDTMGNPNSNLQGTIVSLYDVGWYAYFHSVHVKRQMNFSSFFGAIAAFAFGSVLKRPLLGRKAHTYLTFRRTTWKKENLLYWSDHHVNRSRPTNLRILSRTNDCRSVDYGYEYTLFTKHEARSIDEDFIGLGNGYEMIIKKPRKMAINYYLKRQHCDRSGVAERNVETGMAG